ncbi:MAG TPA: ATP-binding cassette domain-containing protein [Candidatus Krumholzibacteria bacterium]|jgi:ABC-2 type transport system ATP-binding protein|nr:ATP-binding cassette domain-containing protein [Candidatus Krumholzibacteria bacterium]
MIEVQELTKTFGETRAVDAVSFTVRSGEILGFLGPNGAGKTTTMRVITCFLPPTGGRVLVDGLDVVERSLEVRHKIGYLPESAPLYLDMNVVDYLRFIAAVRRVPQAQVREKVRHAVDVCGLDEVVQKNVGQLSSGYRQRVGLAQAILHDPEILVLDEPTRGLDPNQIHEIRDLIKELGRQKTVIFSTHILQEVEVLCDRVLIIDHGKIKFDGSKEDLSLSASGREQLYLEVRADGDVRRTLEQVAQVEAVHVLAKENGRVRLRIEAARGSDVRERIFRTAVEQGWSLLEMRRETRSFEDVFRELTLST